MAFVEGTSAKTNEFLNRLELDVEEGDFVDHWDSGELLFLASSVLRSDRNWASVARSIKPYGEQTRPPDWYTPKNCALQYQKLLNDIEEDTKQKTLPRIERETSEVMLVKNLTEKRLKELEWMNQQTKVAASVTKSYLEMVENGDFDDNLDEILKHLEEEEKTEEEKYNGYLVKRESLNASKRLNKSRVIKSKAKAKVVEPKKRSGFSESADESLQIKEEIDLIKNIKKEIVSDDDSSTSIKPSIVKTEMDAPITLNALLDAKVTLPSSVAPSSPFLTSLLRNITSSASGPQSITSLSSLKESVLMDESDSSKGEADSSTKSRDASPRSSVPQSPYPTPASSPLLNSLLKNSPSSSTSFQLPTGKEISPKEVSSPQPFFNPTSALATAAAQQLAVATSTNPLSHQFFQQHEMSEGSKNSLQSSPVTSASLSAPTLSKLLEMPPSTPGRLPPLPVLDPPTTPTISTPSTTTEHNPLASKASTVQMVQITKKSLPESPAKEVSVNKETLEPTFSTDTSVLQKSLHSYSLADKRAVASTNPKESSLLPSNEKNSGKSKVTPDDPSQENIAILEAVYESINQAFDAKIEKESSKEDKAKTARSLDAGDRPFLPSISQKQANSGKVEKAMPKEELSVVKNLHSAFQEGVKNKTSSSGINTTQESSTSVSESTSIKVVDAPSEEVSERKFYKSRVVNKKEDNAEKLTESASLSHSPKKSSHMKVESENQITSVQENISLLRDVESPESVSEKQQDLKSSKSSDSKSPISKKPRFFEKSSPEKVDLSENETPTIVRRSGRRGKKGFDKMSKNIPLKQIEPKDQYEFTESTEENSVGYQASNTLCYMPRVKDDSRSEDSKEKLTFAQESEIPSANAASVEKKVSTPSRTKQEGTNVQASQVRKALFLNDDEKLTEALISDEASDHVLSEDKLKKWEETCEKKDDTLNVADSTKRAQKGTESLKKKVLPTKRNFAGKSIPGGKERKILSSDAEDVSTGSRDSEEVSNQDKSSLEEKVPVPAASVDMEIETSDSHPSSSNAAESDKQLDDIDGSESFQDSITTEFSPPSANENKESKETPQFGKEDWFHIISPKSSEAVSQSSEESEEYESDNWDNQSVSTNKSISHSTGTQSRPKRKERETPQQKKWKRAIGIVLRQISCHKNASVFLQKVTNDVAPGYLSIVHRPMDLSLIKKNIDNGVITTTEEFHRDIMLMFQNAIMYNNSDHDVHQMAVEMQRDVVELIMTFLSTQSEKDDVTEPVSSLRGARKSQKGLGKHPVSSSSKKTEEPD